MNLKKSIKTVANGATGIVLTAGFLTYMVVASVPVMISNANQAVANKLFS